jgi:hypothetical protein
MAAQKSTTPLAAAVCFGLLLLCIGGFVLKGGGDKPTPPEAPPEVQLAVAGTGCDKAAVVGFAMLGQGFQPGEFVVGGDQIDWSAPEANSRGGAAFGDVTPTTPGELVAKLSSPDEKSVAALNALLFTSAAPREQLLDPNNWVPVQWNVPVDMPGNTAYSGGASTGAGTRHSKAGDVGWYFVKPDKCGQAMDGSVPPHDVIVMVRAGCSNLQTAPVVPANPSPAPAPAPTPGPGPAPAPPTTCDPRICKGPAFKPVPGDNGSGGGGGTGGAEKPGDTGYNPQDPAPTPKVPPAAPPTSVESITPPSVTTIPIVPITAPTG